MATARSARTWQQYDYYYDASAWDDASAYDDGGAYDDGSAYDDHNNDYDYDDVSANDAAADMHRHPYLETRRE